MLDEIIRSVAGRLPVDPFLVIKRQSHIFWETGDLGYDTHTYRTLANLLPREEIFIWWSSRLLFHTVHHLIEEIFVDKRGVIKVFPELWDIAHYEEYVAVNKHLFSTERIPPVERAVLVNAVISYACRNHEVTPCRIMLDVIARAGREDTVIPIEDLYPGLSNRAELEYSLSFIIHVGPGGIHISTLREPKYRLPPRGTGFDAVFVRANMIARWQDTAMNLCRF